MPTSNQKKTTEKPKKPASKKPVSKKTASKKQDDSSPPEPPPSMGIYGYAPRADTDLDLRLKGFISVTRANEEIAHIPVDMFIANLFAKNSLPEADLRFSAVVEAAITVPLNRMVREICDKLIEEHDADRYAEDPDTPAPNSMSALPDFSPNIGQDPDDPALEEEDAEEQEDSREEDES